MSHKANDEFTDFIRDTFANPLRQPPGPNNWHQVQNDDSARGRYYDYELLDQGDETVIVPACEAALQWLYRFLPEDCPRWGACGFKVETKWLKLIQRQMHADNLIAEEEYAAEMNDTARQWD